MVAKKDCSSLIGFDYAHRGLFMSAKGVMENSLDAFQKAVEGGYGMELDVQLTRDGEVVVFHDETLERLYGVSKAIKDADYEQVRFLPTLKDVLALVNGKTPIIVELKSYDRISLLCEKTHALLSGYRGAYAIESFHPMMVRWFRKNAGTVIRGQLVDRQAHLFFCLISRPDFVAAKVGMEKGLMMRMVKKCQKPLLVCWTVRTREEHEAAKKAYDLQIFEQWAIKD